MLHFVCFMRSERSYKGLWGSVEHRPWKGIYIIMLCDAYSTDFTKTYFLHFLINHFTTMEADDFIEQRLAHAIFCQNISSIN